MRNIAIALAATALMVACGEDKREIKDTVFDAQVQALERARRTQETVKEGEQKKRQALEAVEEKPAY